MVWQKLLWIGLAGFAGTLARYGLQGLVQRVSNGGFPWGTLVVNVVGCFAFGVAWALAEERLVIRGETRTIILIGFMGAFTTFSTFAFETSELLRDSEWLLVALNVAGQTVLGLLCVFLGIALGRWIRTRRTRR